jgi:4-hydroxybenzoate polyprenyltransferase
MFVCEHTPGNTGLNGRAVLNVVMYSSLYLSFAAVFMAYVSSAMQDLPVSAAACLIMFLTTFSVYNMNRKTDESEDAINHAERFAFTQKYANHLMAAAVVAYLFSFVIAGFSGLSTVAVASIPLVSGIFYSVAVLPPGFGYRRLKDIPCVKNLLVGVAWATPIALLSPLCIGAPIGMMTAVVGFFFFHHTVINTNLFDKHDVDGANASGVKTLPAILGVGRTRLFLSVANLGGGGAVLLICAGHLPLAAVAAIACIIAYVQGYILLFDRSDREKVVYDLVADGQYFLLGGLIVLSTVLPA